MSTRAALSILSLVLLAACGQKGPLYLPDTGEPSEASQQESSN